MAFFKNFFNKKKSYTKYGDTLKRVLSTKDQRMEAIEVLERQPPEIAIPELLKRFELVVESGLQDTKEKELCLEAILKHPDDAKPFVIHYAQSKRRLAWVLRIAEKILPKEEYLNLLLNNLNSDVLEFDDDTRERNLDILLALKETQSPRITEKVSEFIQSGDDDTQMSALECLEAQAKHDLNAKNIILNLAQNKSYDTNARFMGAVSHIIEKHHW